MDGIDMIDCDPDSDEFGGPAYDIVDPREAHCRPADLERAGEAWESGYPSRVLDTESAQEYFDELMSYTEERRLALRDMAEDDAECIYPRPPTIAQIVVMMVGAL